MVIKNLKNEVEYKKKDKGDIMSVTRFLAGFIVGGAIGAITGILLAPKSGEETREILGENAKIAYKKAQDTVKEIQDKADDAVEEMHKKGEEIIGKIQDMIDKRKEA